LKSYESNKDQLLATYEIWGFYGGEDIGVSGSRSSDLFNDAFSLTQATESNEKVIRELCRTGLGRLFLTKSYFWFSQNPAVHHIF
jgi:hypothetical protein